MTDEKQQARMSTKAQSGQKKVATILASTTQPSMDAVITKKNVAKSSEASSVGKVPLKMKTASEAVAEIPAVKKATAIKSNVKPKAEKVVNKMVVKKQTPKMRVAAVASKKQTIKKEITIMTTEQKKTTVKKNGKLLKESIADIKDVQNVVKSSIAQGSQSIEQVHQTLAKLPLKYLGKIEKIKDTTKDVIDIQEKTIGHLYDLFRSLNDKVFDVSKDVVGLAETK
ncbi:MAG: hypothetical protein JRH15_13970 [Deltaproteobacteria bacterium]|nr:hypothetical protein [Deltaproteobacteria bacterium]